MTKDELLKLVTVLQAELDVTTSLRQIIDAYTLASDPGSLRLRGTKSQPQQEPVAWRYKYKFKDIGETGAYEYHSHAFACVANLPCGEPLYTTPPAAQRQWVGLTDEEVMQTMSGDWTSQFYFARAIETKLKEKNT